jgi:hypothetical protein
VINSTQTSARVTRVQSTVRASDGSLEADGSPSGCRTAEAAETDDRPPAHLRHRRERQLDVMRVEAQQLVVGLDRWATPLN